MPKRARRRAGLQNPRSPAPQSASGSNHPTSPGIDVATPPSPPHWGAFHAPAGQFAPSPSPASPPAIAAWQSGNSYPWSHLSKPIESCPAETLPTPDSPVSRPLTLDPPRTPACAPSPRPPRAPSGVSCSSPSRSDSGVLLEAPQSSSSKVTSISIPPSVKSELCSLPPPPFCPPPITCHAPKPIRKISTLSNLSNKTTRHSQFYFTDDLVTLNVDGCLFRVHKGYLERESSYFRKLFMKEAGRGLSDDAAIELPQVTVGAFELLLKFLYFGIHEPYSYPVEDWISILAAASSLSLSRIRERALAELETENSCLDAVDRLLLADRYDIDHWRAPAYIQLCTRDRPIQESEATLLGVKVTSQLAEIREKALLEMLEECYARECQPRKPGVKAWNRPSRDIDRVAQMVDEVFWPHEIPIPCRP